MFIPHVYLAPPQGVTRRNFVKMFDAGKTRMIGLPYGEKTMTICQVVFIWYRNVNDGQTDGQNCYINVSVSHVSVLTRDTLTRDKNRIVQINFGLKPKLLLKLLLYFGFRITSWVYTKFKTELRRHFKFPLKFSFKRSFGLKPKFRTKF